MILHEKNPDSINVGTERRVGEILQHYSVKLVKRARIILELDTSEGRTATKQEEISKRVDVSRKTVNEAKQDFLITESVSAFLQRKKRETPPVAPR